MINDKAKAARREQLLKQRELLDNALGVLKDWQRKPFQET